MIIDTQDTNNSIRWMVISTQDIDYSIGVLITTHASPGL